MARPETGVGVIGVAAWFVLLGASCELNRVRETPSHLRIIVEPSRADVFIDDEYAASAKVLAVRPQALEPGTHDVTVEASGHFPHDLQIDVPPGETTLRIKLRPIPP